MELEADDPEAAVNRITVIVESFGGYIARLSMSGHEGKSAGVIVIANIRSKWNVHLRQR